VHERIRRYLLNKSGVKLIMYNVVYMQGVPHATHDTIIFALFSYRRKKNVIIFFGAVSYVAPLLPRHSKRAVYRFSCAAINGTAPKSICHIAFSAIGKWRENDDNAACRVWNTAYIYNIVLLERTTNIYSCTHDLCH